MGRLPPFEVGNNLEAVASKVGQLYAAGLDIKQISRPQRCFQERR